MGENNFQLSREGHERLRVKTPFPVSQNVWASFVLEIFQEFVTPPEHLNQYRHNGRYVNRNPNSYDEIADGQALGYIHAYLPHGMRSRGERSLGREDVSGLIHVPEKRLFYLEQIEADLSENPKSRAALLDRLKQINAETISYLLNELMEVPRRTIFKNVKTTKELRDRFGENIAERGLFSGYYNNPGETPVREYEIGKIPIGKLPLYMRGQNLNFLRTQTCLDFLRDLDMVLGTDRELRPVVDMLQIPAVMNQKYSSGY